MLVFVSFFGNETTILNSDKKHELMYLLPSFLRFKSNQNLTLFIALRKASPINDCAEDGSPEVV